MDHQASIVSRNIIVTGGIGSDGPSSKIFIFNTINGIWSRLEINFEFPIFAHCTCSTNLGKLYIFGGMKSYLYTSNSKASRNETTTIIMTMDSNSEESSERKILQSYTQHQKMEFCSEATLLYHRELSTAFLFGGWDGFKGTNRMYTISIS